MRIATLLVCLGYWVLLTVLLLVPNPAAVVGLDAVPIFPWGKFGVHLLAFTGLSVLVHVSRWPRRLGWPLLLLLFAYGIATEMLQALVPPRTSRVMDGIEDILGVLAGVGICWLVRQVVRSLGTKSNLAAQAIRCAAKTDATAE
jgi:hypothetical protein